MPAMDQQALPFFILAGGLPLGAPNGLPLGAGLPLPGTAGLPPFSNGTNAMMVMSWLVYNTTTYCPGPHADLIASVRE